MPSPKVTPNDELDHSPPERAKLTAVISPNSILSAGNEVGFLKALEAIMDGKHVTRHEWPAGYYCLMHNSRLCIHTDQMHTWIISDGDMAGEDWVIL